MDFSFGSIFAIFVAFGLITTDAVLNANSLYIDVHVAPSMEDKGYSAEVVQAEMVEEMRRVANIHSLVAAPQIRSSASESISVALADLANLGDTMKDVQSLVGYAPPKLNVAVIEENDELILKASGISAVSGQILVEVPKGDGSIRDMITKASRETLRLLEPYIVVLDDFGDNIENHEVLARIGEQLEAEILRLPPTPVNRLRAPFENLVGILALHQNEVEPAEEHFRHAIESAPGFAVPRLNLAFVQIQLDRYQEAIDTITEMVEPWYWPSIDNPVLLATAHIIRGVGYWGLEMFAEAQAEFAYAATLNPQSTEVYVYWGRLLQELDREAEAQQKLRQARQNLAFFENYPEVALLYFWLNEKDGEPLNRRSAVINSLDVGRH